MLLTDVAATSADLATTPARRAKVGRIATLLTAVAAAHEPVAVVAAWLSGDLPQRQIGVGWASLRELPPPATAATLTIGSVDARFSELKAVAGRGSRARRTELVQDLFTTATATEQTFLRRLVTGELRQGAQTGVMADAIAEAANLPPAEVRRAAMLAGDLPAVACAALTRGRAALAEFQLQVGRPVGPMLAQAATSIDDALEKLGGTAVLETKLDGARVQIHRDADKVSIFTRSLDDVTHRLPEVVAMVLTLPVRTLIADAEAIAMRPDGRPHPFQVTASRFGRKKPGDAHPLSVFIFDLLHLDGHDLLDLPTAERIATLERIIPAPHRVDRVQTSDPAVGAQFFDHVLTRGHEGVMAKSPTAPYQAGRRGAGWLKVKPVHTLDLVVLAVEWGSGRRNGKLSNIHLGARDPATGGFVMLGKTFKGMTDALLDWQTDRFTELATSPTDQYVVTVRPEQVVEIAFDGVQRSSRYPGGMALRFARVVRYRTDKTADQADTIESVSTFLA